jgi:hypothetical protein
MVDWEEVIAAICTFLFILFWVSAEIKRLFDIICG